MPPAQEEMEGRPKGRASYINLNPHYRGRVRSGCLTCRSCKVKCDEHRPKCKRCVRLKRGCVYPNPTSRQASATLCDAEEELSGQQHSSCNPSVSEQDLDMESRCGVLLRYSGSIQDTEPDPHPKSPSQTRLPSPGGLELSLPVMQELGQAEERLVTGSETLSQMISRDIHLCITIDWLSANESLHPLSFTYFLHEVDFHLVTPFDPVNWERMKSYAVKVATRHKPVATAISALELLFRAQHHALSNITAINRYEKAKTTFMATVAGAGNGMDFECILITVFILTLFSVLLFEGEDCILKQPHGPLLEKLEAWSLPRVETETPVVSRITAWLSIMHAAARRGGNRGIMSASVLELLSGADDEFPSLVPLEPDSRYPIASHESLCATVFDFYRALQRLSLKVANLSHYHRSRRTSADQDDVIKLMASIEAQLHALWQSRPEIMRCDLIAIRSRSPSSNLRPLARLVAVSATAYYAERIEIGRNLSQQQSATPEAQEAMRQIRHLVEDERNASERGQVSQGFLRPLFLYAIEATDSAHVQWAIGAMKEIKDPICRSDFFRIVRTMYCRSTENAGEEMHDEMGLLPEFWCRTSNFVIRLSRSKLQLSYRTRLPLLATDVQTW